MLERWPDLPYASWKDTCATLHRFSQLVGKIALRTTPLVNHFWNASLLPSARGLRTRPLPGGDGTTFELELDLVSHELAIRGSEGEVRLIPLTGCTVATFCRGALEELSQMGLPVAINDRPVEIPTDAIPLLKDNLHGTYDPAQAHAWHRILLSTTEVMSRFRAGFVGKCSPVQFWWGSFDLAVTRFSGRRAPPRTTPMEREAYSHECSSAGLWPGDENLGGPWFYAYTVPAPPGLERAPLRPPEAAWSSKLGEHLLSYEAVRKAPDPDAALLSFLESAYVAGATLGGWDRASLERREERTPSVPATEVAAPHD